MRSATTNRGKPVHKKNALRYSNLQETVLPQILYLLLYFEVLSTLCISMYVCTVCASSIHANMKEEHVCGSIHFMYVYMEVNSNSV